jgi:hypothetical protein
MMGFITDIFNVKLSGKYHDESFPEKYPLRVPVNFQWKGLSPVVFVSFNDWL